MAVAVQFDVASRQKSLLKHLTLKLEPQVSGHIEKRAWKKLTGHPDSHCL